MSHFCRPCTAGANILPPLNQFLRQATATARLTAESKAFGKTRADGFMCRASGLEGTSSLRRRISLRPPVATNSPLSSSSSGLRPSASPNVAHTSSLPSRRTSAHPLFRLRSSALYAAALHNHCRRQQHFPLRSNAGVSGGLSPCMKSRLPREAA